MNVAIGYHWFSHHAAYHLERAILDAGDRLCYVGLPSAGRPGYDSRVPIDSLVQNLPVFPAFYLWIDPAGPYFPPAIENLSFPTACYLIDVHIGSWREHAARFFDVVFVAQKDYVPIYRKIVGHDQVYWLPLGAAPDIHRRHNLPIQFDVAFVGSISIAHRRSSSRLRRLNLIQQRYRTNDVFSSTPPEEVSLIYSQARIVLNTSIAGDVTMRIFEGTASGAMVLTDSTANGLSDLFELGREIVVYDDDQDLLEKIEFYLAYDDERSRIAEAGYQRTHGEHTYKHRYVEISTVMLQDGIQKCAPLRAASPRERRNERRHVLTSLHMVDAILDDSHSAKHNPLQRAWDIGPALARRLFR